MPTLAEFREIRMLPHPTPEAIEEALDTVRLWETANLGGVPVTLAGHGAWLVGCYRGYLGDDEAVAQISQELRRLRRGGRYK